MVKRNSIRAAAVAALAMVPAAWLGGCAEEEPTGGDWQEIAARDTLVAAVRTNSTTYFLYRGTPMGYEYELLQAFAEENDLELRVVLARGDQALDDLVNTGEADIAAGRLVARSELGEELAFTEPLTATRQVLVQRTLPLDSLDVPQPVDRLADSLAERRLPRPDDAAGTSTQATSPGSTAQDSVRIRARLVRSPEQLGGEEVTVPRRSPYAYTLVELSDSISGDIKVVEVEADVSTERLMEEVAAGSVHFTVAHESVAQLTEERFDNLWVRPVVGPPLMTAWAVRSNAPELVRRLNAWIIENRDSELGQSLHEKYFIDRAGYRERVESEYLSSETGRLSEYDELLKRHAPAIDWDWRLLASQTYQESKFKPRARSWAGAMGLLQLMPGTAREVEVGDAYDPEQNVAGAVRYLAKLEESWGPEIADPEQRLRFVLASYNTGRGHVLDAQRLAEKHGANPQVWDEVAFWLLRKSERQYYEDPVVKHGFARGLEPVTYVERILDRFEHYREFVVDEGEASD